MEDIDLAYLIIRERLLDELSDEEFVAWIVCPDCVSQDYQSLVEVLLEKGMTDRVRMVSKYLNRDDKSV